MSGWPRTRLASEYHSKREGRGKEGKMKTILYVHAGGATEALLPPLSLATYTR